MQHADHVDAVAHELTALVTAVAAGPLDARVPTCPDFSVDDLAKHVGEFCGFWSHVLCEGTGRPKTPFRPEPGAEGRVAWLDALAGHLVGELRATPPDTPVWTWYEPDQSARFVARRCAHETAVHRVDAQLSRGPAAPVAAALAADGIEEIFLLVSAGGPDGRRGTGGTGQTLHVHGADIDAAEWLIILEPDGMKVERRHAEADLTIRGDVGDLEMLLYQRPPTGPVERVGDETVLDTFYGEFTFG